MKRSILVICVTAVVIALVAAPGEAALPDTNPLPNGKPYQMIWDLFLNIQDQINNIQLIPGPQGDPGLDCWDLNGNGVCDPNPEDKTGDGSCTVADCQGPPGNPGPDGKDGAPGTPGTPGADGIDGVRGEPGLACWDLDGNGNCDTVTEDKTGDGSCTVADCQGPQGSQGPAGSPETCSDCTCPPGRFVTGFDANGDLICSDLGLCNPGLGFCNGECVDLDADIDNCGSCGATCPSGGACRNGQCGCGVGLTGCNGVCVNLQTDGNNCGACGTTCQGNYICRCGVCSPPPDDRKTDCKDDSYCRSRPNEYCAWWGECAWKICTGSPCTTGNSCVSGTCTAGYCS